MDKLRELQAERAKAQAEAEGLLFEADGKQRADVTQEARDEADKLLLVMQGLDKDIKPLLEDERRFKAVALAKAKMQEDAQARQTASARPEIETATLERKVPASARRYGGLRAFTGEHGELEAYRFGVWFAGTRGVPWAVQRCRDLGLSVQRAASEGTNTAGGFAVPDEFSARFIQLRERYGTFRRNAYIEPMTSDSKHILRQTDGLTAYAINEGGAATESQLTFDHVNLVAKKFGCISVFSSELAEDAIIAIADKLADGIGHAMALKEDQCAFIADGQATYHGIVGIGPHLIDVNGVDEGGGLILGTGDLPSELAIGDWGKVPGLLPAYVDPQRCKWYMHKTVYSQGWTRLMIALAGNDWGVVREGEQGPRILGYPVEYVQCMNTGSAVSQILAIFGDLALASTMGDRRGLTIGMSTEGTVGSINLFEMDSSAIRGVARFDINVHDVGTATVAGPVVALIGKAS